MARSQAATSWQPAAVATPSTAAITGFGSATIACMRVAQRAMICSLIGAAAVGIVAMRLNLPQVVARAERGPSPVSTTTRAFSSLAMSAKVDDQRVDHRKAERIAVLRRRQGQGDDAAGIVLAADEFRGGGGGGNSGHGVIQAGIVTTVRLRGFASIPAALVRRRPCIASDRCAASRVFLLSPPRVFG